MFSDLKAFLKLLPLHSSSFWAVSLLERLASWERVFALNILSDHLKLKKVIIAHLDHVSSAVRPAPVSNVYYL